MEGRVTRGAKGARRSTRIRDAPRGAVVTFGIGAEREGKSK